MLQNVLQVWGTEWIILVIVVLVLIFGAKKIPELARAVGKSAGEFRKGREEAEKELKVSEEGQKGESEKDRVLKAAKELGIETEGKSIDELREEIKKALA